MPITKLGLTLGLETVTPLFLGGADPRRNAPEVRGASFRGIMRYWFRVVTGGVIGDRNIAELQQMETSIFGSTETGSLLTIRPLTYDLPNGLEPILPHKGPQSGTRRAFKAQLPITVRLEQIHSADTDVWRVACSVSRSLSRSEALVYGVGGGTAHCELSLHLTVHWLLLSLHPCGLGKPTFVILPPLPSV
jgi:hypothetical protein